MISNTGLKITITGDSSQFQAEADKAGRSARRIADSVGEVSKSSLAANSSIAAFAQTLAGAMSVREIAQASDAWATLNSRISIASHSMSEAAQAMSSIYAIAQKTGVDLGSIGDVYQKLARNARQYGMDQQAVVGVTQDIANAMRLSGGSAASASAALMQFGQSLSSGQLRGEELNSVLEQAPALAEAIARGMGKTTGELKKLGEDGLLPIKDVLAAIRAESARLDDEAGGMANTVSASIQRLQNAWQKFAGTDASGAARVMASGVDALTNNLDKAAVAVGTFALGWAALGARGAVISTLSAASASIHGLTVAQVAAADAALAHAAAQANLRLAQTGTLGSTTALTAATSRLLEAQELSSLSNAIGAFGRLSVAIGGAGLALSSLMIVWKDYQEMKSLEESGGGAIAKQAQRLATDLRKASTEVGTMTQATYQQILKSSQSEQDRLVHEAEKAQRKLDSFDGNRVSDEYINIQTEAASAQRKVKESADALAGFGAVAERVGQKPIDDYFDKFGSKARKAADELKKLKESHSATVSWMEKNGSSREAISALDSDFQRRSKEITDSAAVKKTASDYDQLIKSLHEKIAVEQAGIGTTASLTDGQKTAAKVAADLADGTLKLSGAQKESVQAGLAQLMNLERQNALEKERAEWLGKMVSDAQRQADGTIEANGRLKEEVALIGLSAEEQTKYQVEKLRTRAAADEAAASQAEENARLEEANGACTAASAAYRELALAKQASAGAAMDQIGLLEMRQAAQAAVRAAEESTRAWQKFADDIERSLTDALFRAFESGDGFGKAFTKNLENALKTMVLKFMIQQAVATGGSVLNSGINAMLGTGGANSGGGVNYFGLASTGSSLYNLASGSYLGYYQAAQAGYGMTAAEAQAAASAYYNAGYYGTGAAIQAGSATAGAAEAGSAAYGSATSTGLGTAGVYAAAALIGYQIGTWLGGYMFGGKVSSQGSGLQGTVSYNGSSGLEYYQDMHQSGGWFRSGRDWTNTYGLDNSQRSAYFSAIAAMDDPYLALQAATGGDAAQLYNRGQSWSYGFKQGDIGSLFSSMADSLGQTLVPELVKFRKEGEKLADTATRMLSTVALTNNLAEILGKPMAVAFGALGVASLDARQAIVDAAGGLDALKESVTSYYNTYLSSAEQNAFAAQQMGAAFQALSLTMPTTKAGFRALVESLDLTTAAGQKSLAALLKLAPTFAEWSKTIDQGLSGLYTDQEKFDRSLADVSQTFTDFGLAMPATKAGFRELVSGLDMTTSAGTKVYGALMGVADAFTTLMDQIDQQISSLEGQQLNIAQNVVGERDALIKDVLTAMGKSAEVRALDLSKVDPLNIGLAKLSGAFQDAQSAAQKLANAQAVAAQAQAEYTSSLVSAGGGIAEYVATLRNGISSAATGGVANTYAADLSAAKAGDTAASQRLPGSAQAYLEEIKKSATSSMEIDVAMTRVAAELEALPATQSWQQQQTAALNAIAKNLQDSQAGLSSALETWVKSMSAVLSNGFGAFDSSLNGLLTFDEIKVALGGLASDDQIRSLISSVDRNGDGQIGATELVKQATDSVGDNTAGLLDGNNSQIIEMRRMVAATAVNSSHLIALNASIQELKGEIAWQNEAKKKEADIAAANLALEALVKQQAGTVDAVNAGIQSIWALAGKFGVQLHNSAGGSAYFGIDANKTFQSDYGSIEYWDAASAVAFRDAFYSAGGVYDQTYGMAGELVSLKAKIDLAREAVTALGGVPKFESGGIHMGGVRLVGERGPELEVTGPARYYSHAQTKALFAGGSNADLLAELRALRSDNADLRAEVRAVAVHSHSASRRLDQVVNDGVVVRTDAGYPLKTVAA